MVEAWRYVLCNIGIIQRDGDGELVEKVLVLCIG